MNVVELKVKRLRNVPLPGYQTEGASGMDLYAAVDEPVSIPAGSSYTFPTGIALEIPQGYEGQVRPRSGLADMGILSAFGTIDSDYRGEIKVILYNVRFYPAFEVKPFMRIAQLVIAPVQRAVLVEVNKLSPTLRGERGLGSTGLLLEGHKGDLYSFGVNSD